MSDSIKVKTTFRVGRVPDEWAGRLVETTVFSPGGALISARGDRFELELSPGIYRARTHIGALFEDKIFKVVDDQPTEVELGYPSSSVGLNSASPERSPFPVMIKYPRVKVGKAEDASIRPIPLSSDTQELIVRFTLLMRSTKAIGKAIADIFIENESGYPAVQLTDFAPQSVDSSTASIDLNLKPGNYRVSLKKSGDFNAWIPLPVFPGLDNMDPCFLEVVIPYDEFPVLPEISISYRSLNKSFPKMIEQWLPTFVQFSQEELKNPVIVKTVSDYLRKVSISNPIDAFMAIHLALVLGVWKKNEFTSRFLALEKSAPNSPDLEAIRYLAVKKNLLSREINHCWKYSGFPFLKLSADAMRQCLNSEPLDCTWVENPSDVENFFLYLTGGTPWCKRLGLKRPPNPLKAQHLSLKYLFLHHLSLKSLSRYLLIQHLLTQEWIPG